MNNTWENYGDVNPIEHGGMFVKHDTEIAEVSPRCYYVVQFYPFVEGGEIKWLLIDGYVDLDDDWIEWDSVEDTMGIKKGADDFSLTVDLMHYYGTHLSNGKEELFCSEESLREWLVARGIEVE